MDLFLSVVVAVYFVLFLYRHEVADFMLQVTQPYPEGRRPGRSVACCAQEPRSPLLSPLPPPTSMPPVQISPPSPVAPVLPGPQPAQPPPLPCFNCEASDGMLRPCSDWGASGESCYGDIIRDLERAREPAAPSPASPARDPQPVASLPSALRELGAPLPCSSAPELPPAGVGAEVGAEAEAGAGGRAWDVLPEGGCPNPQQEPPCAGDAH